MPTLVRDQAEDLLPLIARGDQEAVARCLDRYGPLVWSLVGRSLRDRDEAEDAAQEIFVHLWQKAALFDPARGSEVTFVTTITRRRLIDRVRRSRVRPDSAELGEIEPSAEDANLAALELSDEARRAREVLDELRPEQRKLVMLSVVEGMSHGQISQALGLPLGTVKSTLRRAIERVRSVLGSPASLQQGGVAS